MIAHRTAIGRVSSATDRDAASGQSTIPASERPRPRRTRRPGQWCWLDTAIVATYGPQIGAYGIAVYAALASHANGKTQDCWPSIGRLASELKLSRATVKRTLRTLREVKLIATDARTDPAGDPMSNMYTLLDPTPEKPVSLAAVPQGSRVPQTPPSVPTDPTGRVSQTPKPDPLQPKERTRFSDDRSAWKRGGDTSDETSSWDKAAVIVPVTTDRPDDVLGVQDLSAEAYATLEAEARAELIAEGAKAFCIESKPVREAKMVTIFERRCVVVSVDVSSDNAVPKQEEYAPSALPAAGSDVAMPLEASRSA